MADELRCVDPTGNTCYAVIYSATGTVWNGSSFVTPASANWGTYAVTLTEQGGTGFYLGSMPAGIGAGTYSTYAYEQQGGSPAVGDTAIHGGAQTIYIATVNPAFAFPAFTGTPVSAEDVLNQAKTYLAQAWDTLIASLPDGITQNSYIIDSDDQLVKWVNEGGQRIAKLCVPIYDTASISALGSGAPHRRPVHQYLQRQRTQAQARHRY